MEAGSKLNYIVIGIVVLALLAGGFWYWQSKKAPPTSPEIPAETQSKDRLGAEAFKKSNNPLSNELPETNPFQVNTNPFK